MRNTASAYGISLPRIHIMLKLNFDLLGSKYRVLYRAYREAQDAALQFVDFSDRYEAQRFARDVGRLASHVELKQVSIQV